MSENNQKRAWLEYRLHALQNGQEALGFWDWVGRQHADELATVQTERDALMAVLVGLHDLLNRAGIEQQGNLTERVALALERLKKAEASEQVADKVALDVVHARNDAQTALKHAEKSAQHWKAAAKRFRRRWRDACAEIEDDKKPICRLIEWLQAVNLHPTDVFETSDPYTIYTSFKEPISSAALRVLPGMNLNVETTPIHNRYKITFVPSPDDEV